MQGDREEASHEALGQKRKARERKEIFGRESPDKLDKPPTCYASGHGPAVLALNA